MRLFSNEQVKAMEINEEAALEVAFSICELGRSWSQFLALIHVRGHLKVLKVGNELVVARILDKHRFEEIASTVVTSGNNAVNPDDINYILEKLEESESVESIKYWEEEASIWLDYFGAFGDVGPSAKKLNEILERKGM